jgi:3-hydroxyisobutyrate dehydrogenase
MINEKPKVGWIGLGVMGAAMVRHLINDGHPVIVHSRTPSKAKPLLDVGAEWADSPASIATRVDYLFSMVGYPADVEDVYFGKEGVFSDLSKGTVVIDMTTSSPELAKKISDYALKKESFSLDAPVSGGDIGAKNASLAIMCGGFHETFLKVLPLLKVIGEKIEFFGSPGAGQKTKMSNQILIASTMIGTVESMLYAEKSNLDLAKVIGLIGQGAAGCWSLNQLGPRMVSNDWEPGFFIKHFVKDMGIALEDCESMGIRLKGLELAHQFYQKAIDSGYQDKGTQALLKILRELNNLSKHQE